MTEDKARRSLPRAGPDAPALVDTVLVMRARSGDPAAFELIMRRYNQRLYRLARGILRNSSDAEDTVQETYLHAFEKLGDFLGPDGFASWLGRIAINAALGRLRKRGKVVSFDDYTKDAGNGANPTRLETMQTQMPDPERLAASSELRRVLENALDALPDDFRAVFILRAVEGMSIAETAECLGIRPETVKTRFHRARQLLQANLGAQFETLMPSTFAFAGARCDRIVASVLQRLAPAFAPPPDESTPSG